LTSVYPDDVIDVLANCKKGVKSRRI